MFRVLLFLLVLIAIAEATGLRSEFSLAAVQDKLAENRFSALTIFILLFAIGNVLHIPGWLFLASAVLVLGRSLGGLVTYVAASLSCAFTFLLVRWVGGDAIRQLENARIVRLVSRLHGNPIRNIALLRMFLQTMPTLNFALALSGVGFRDYMIATLLGLPLPIAAYCLFFDYLIGILRA